MSKLQRHYVAVKSGVTRAFIVVFVLVLALLSQMLYSAKGLGSTVKATSAIAVFPKAKQLAVNPCNVQPAGIGRTVRFVTASAPMG